jgi:hypothetical protein
MLIESIAAAWHVTEDIADDGRSPSLADAAAAYERRLVASLDDWPAFGRLLVWATRNNHPGRFRCEGSDGL